MLSQVELERVAAVLSREAVGGVVERWVEPGRGRLAFSLYLPRSASSAPRARPSAIETDAETDDRDEDGGRKLVLEIDARPEVARLGRIARLPRAPDQLPAFAAYLRAHLGRARLESAALRGDDRQLELRFSAREGEYALLLSIFGRRSNLYLLDAGERLLQALRPLAETRGELAIGAPWVDPSSGAPRRGGDRFADVDGLALLDAISSRYAEDLEERAEDDVRRRLLGALKRERKSAARRLERIEAELAEAEEANTLQRHGELLKAHLGDVPSGAESIRVADFETGEPVEIRLDPKLSARDNLQAIFKRYQKLLRRLTKAGGQVDAARETLREIEELEAEVRATAAGGGGEAGADEAISGEAVFREAGAGDAALADLLARPLVQRLLASSKGSKGAPGAVVGTAVGTVLEGATSARPAGPARPSLPAAFARLPRKLHPRRYRSVDGLEIWVGRSDEANDVLSTRLARGKDLFFHLDGAPGSHVVLRTEGRDDVPAESVLDACELAVHFSKQKNAGRADVHVVPIKNVKKPKSAKRGLVYVTGGKSVHLRREPARLERVLASRIEDRAD
jgi:predicted ribosome quality control (RQC) complex YloA/Tae2 family protein